MKRESSQMHPPGLYIMATPIGNLGDITLRALELLKIADLVVCEDTRVTGALLSHYGISAQKLSYNDHNGDERRPVILAALSQGKRVVLVSDAGTPLVSDPGYKLVRAAMEAGFHVSVLPGASSVLAALCLSGLPSDRFFFGGFLPSKQEAKQQEIAVLAKIPATLILFESANRLIDTLGALQVILHNREVAVVREITKLFEETKRGTIAELMEYYAEVGAPKGEVVLVIAPPSENNANISDITAQLAVLLKTHSVKEAASVLAEATGRPRKEIYQLALTMLDKNEPR